MSDQQKQSAVIADLSSYRSELSQLAAKQDVLDFNYFKTQFSTRTRTKLVGIYNESTMHVLL